MKNQSVKSIKKYEMDMCNGPLLRKLLVFALPLMASGVLQILFNAVDIAVVGRFVGENALAAVGSTSSLVNLLINLFMGLSVGVNVLVARYIGAGDKKSVQEVVQTAVSIAFVCGVILAFLGWLLAFPLLRLMDTPENVIGEAVLYFRIYFLGAPVMLLYNFGSAVLRAVGDTRRPMRYLLFAGICNVILNLFCVLVLHIGVAGVAVATLLSNTISAALVLRCLMLPGSDYQLQRVCLQVNRTRLMQLARIGMPAGLQSVLFSLANVVIQSSINSFGAVAMAGNAAGNNLGSFVNVVVQGVHRSVVSFTSQNYGAKNIKRIAHILWLGIGLAIVTGLAVGNGIYFFSDRLLRLYTSDPGVIEIGMLRMSIVCTFFFLGGMMEAVVGVIRGMGYSLLPMSVALLGTCAFRILWVAVVFKRYPTLECLYWVIPVSWTITFAAHMICFLVVYKKLRREWRDIEA